MSGARILVVEDEAQLRLAVARSLEGHGYVVREAGDGAWWSHRAGALVMETIALAPMALALPEDRTAG
jgi:CheY-like chemotaxis protein